MPPPRGRESARPPRGRRATRVSSALALAMTLAAVTVTAAAAGPFEDAPLFGDDVGSLGSAPGQLSNPRGVAVDSAGNTYVADTGNSRVVVFDPEGRFVRSWGGFGNATGQFVKPWDLTVDNTDLVYVADTGNSRVQVFQTDGTFERAWGSLGGRTGRFRGPKGLGHDSLNNIYVADTGNHRIQKFDTFGNLIAVWGTGGAASGPGRFDSPRDVTASLNNRVFVADTNNDRIQSFDLSGNYVGEWGASGTGDGQFDRPQGVFIRNQNSVTTTVFVADTGNDRVQMFANDGTYLDQFGGGGTGNGRFDQPRGLFVTASLSVYATDLGGDRVERLDSPIAEGITGTVTGTDGVTDQGALDDAVVTVSDSTTFDLVAMARTGADGRYQVPVAPGSYVLAFFDPTGAHDYEYFDDQPDFTTAQPVVVTGGVVTTADAALTELPSVPVVDPGTIAGTVTDHDGVGAGVWVMAVDSTGTPARSTIVDPTGHYEIDGLAPGAYLVLFMDPQGVDVTEFYDDTPDPTFADQVAVTGGATTQVDATLSP